MLIGKLITWIIIGALAGTLAGRLMTFSKQGLGHWKNILMGMVGAVVGGFIFWLLKIDFGWGELKITAQDLVAAFLGSVLCIVAWRLMRKKPDAKKEGP